jgi:hypothetical protein
MHEQMISGLRHTCYSRSLVKVCWLTNVKNLKFLGELMFVNTSQFSLIWLNLICHIILGKLNMLFKYKAYAGKCEKINIK